MRSPSEARDAFQLLAERLKQPSANPADLSKVQAKRFGWLFSTAQEAEYVLTRSCFSRVLICRVLLVLARRAMSLLDQLMSDQFSSGGPKLSSEAMSELLMLVWNAAVDCFQVFCSNSHSHALSTYLLFLSVSCVLTFLFVEEGLRPRSHFLHEGPAAHPT